MARDYADPIVEQEPEQLPINAQNNTVPVRGADFDAEGEEITKAKKNIVNTITVREVKKLINKAILEILPKLGFRLKKVDELPAVGENGVIYLVPAEGATSPNIYEEYYWVADDNDFELIGTTEVDLSNLVDLTSDQTIRGTKTLLEVPIVFSHSDASGEAKWTIEEDQYGQLVVSRIYNGVKTTYWEFNGSMLNPKTDNVSNIGSDTRRIKDIFVAGILSDGTDSTTVADLVKGSINVINASDIVNNTLTQAQYDLITNGKPTLIMGSISISSEPLENPIISPMTIGNSNTFGLLVATVSNGRSWIYQLQINNSSKVISLGSSGAGNQIRIAGLEAVNGKYLPAYPANTGTFVLKCVNGVLTWVAE